ncbi:MAG: carbohydrate kinase family protein [Melioribacteraceae bacterium]
MNNTKNEYDVMVIGELNVDLILNKINSFPEIGKEILASSMDLVLGSSSAIFACNLSSLGAKVAFIGKIGKDIFGDLVLSTLKEKGVSIDFIIRDDKLKTGATVVLNYDQDRANITHPGAMEHLSINDITIESLQTAKHVHISSIFLQPNLKKDVYEIFKMAKDAGLTTSLDVQWDPAEEWDVDLEKLLPYVDVFLPNEEELKNLMKEDALQNAIKKVSPHGNIIALKRGNKGSICIYKNKQNEVPPFLNTNVVDAIGAGDSFNAGFIFKYIRGSKINQCQKFGNLTGAINTTEAGGTAAFINFDHIMKIAVEKFNYAE